MAAMLVIALLSAGRDPFTQDKKPQTPPTEPCTEDLCRFRLDDLKLVAIISGDANPVAMFEDPRGKGLIARRFDRIGTQGGRVTAITRRCVTVTTGSEKTDVCIADEPTEL